MIKKQRLGLFGGTFNPVHLGHLKAAEEVYKKFVLNRILFIPSYIPPHKKTGEIASPDHRYTMTKLAVSSYPYFDVSSIEIKAKEKSYSIITLNKMKRIYPGTDIFFILGVDAFLEIDTWKDYKKVIENCFFIVISRPGYEIDKAKQILGNEYKEKIIDVSQGVELTKDIISDFSIFLYKFNALDISSTEIRKRIRKKLSIKKLVPENVEQYIIDNNIFINEEND
ncbi:MAG: nicotinate-nucleotide adenylyltransferase [Candidatus Aminicenantaceae bacterium]